MKNVCETPIARQIPIAGDATHKECNAYTALGLLVQDNGDQLYDAMQVFRGLGHAVECYHLSKMTYNCALCSSACDRACGEKVNSGAFLWVPLLCWLLGSTHPYTQLFLDWFTKQTCQMDQPKDTGGIVGTVTIQ